MSAVAEAPFSLKIPVFNADVFAGLLDQKSWGEEFKKVRLPYETRVLAESQLGPQMWVRLTAYTIGGGGGAGSIWIELASRRPSPVETVTGRGLLRAFASISSERRRLLDRLLLHFVLLEYTDQAVRPAWHGPSGTFGLGGALVAAEATAVPGIWRALERDLDRNRPTAVVSLRDGGGTPGLEAFDGLITCPMEVGALTRRRILDELPDRWKTPLGRGDPGRGIGWVRDQIGPSRELETASFLSTHLRFGEIRRRFEDVPKRLREGELGVYYPRDDAEAAECATAALLPVAPGIFWDVAHGLGGDQRTTAGYAAQTQGASAFTGIATPLVPERRANFLLAAASAVIVAAASGQIA